MNTDVKMNDSPSTKNTYEGKAKTVEVLSDEKVRIIFTDRISAGDGAKLDTIPGKGKMNLTLSNRLMEVLEEAGIPTHLLERESETTIIARNLRILPVEVVVRNIAAGSFSRRYGVKEGEELAQPFVEFFVKDDKLHDPLIDRDVVVQMGLVPRDKLELVQARALQVNRVFTDYFSRGGMVLVDFKLEFGEDKEGHIWLADEISADSMRVWDAQTMEKLDKDRFRKDLGDVLAGYKVIMDRLDGIGGYSPEKQRMEVVVTIEPKHSVTNPGGEVTKRTLLNSGMGGIKDVRLGKTVNITVEDSSDPKWLDKLNQICKEILTNPMVETYTLGFR